MFLGIVGVLIAAGWAVIHFSSQNRIVVRNASPAPAANLRLILSYEGKPTSTFSRSLLLPGEAWVIRHRYHDSRAAVQFSWGGMSRSFVAPYVDLWTGEGWVLELQPDGSVKQGYDYPNSRLR